MSDVTPQEQQLDREAEGLLQELAVRESFHILQRLFVALNEKNRMMLIRAEDDSDRVYCQAHARIVDDMQRRMQKYRSNVVKDKPIMIGSAPPVQNQ